ncbi:hypothetical protein GWL_08250 [Herbaspirillum sp. GW103]|nr:hypothetical protein GWL_08250 [Herbaspirillum sp. GW103]
MGSGHGGYSNLNTRLNIFKQEACQLVRQAAGKRQKASPRGFAR